MIDGFMRSFGLHRREVVLAAPLAGHTVPLSSVNDETFASGMLGEGVAIQPSSNRVVAPADAKVEAIFPTGHALALTTIDGLEILIHLGLETVKLQGKHFRVLAEQGATVRRGDPLIEFDREAIAFEGYDIIVPVLIRNTVEYSSLRCHEDRQVDELDELIVARVR